MQVNYLIAGLYGEEAGRHIFETICGLLILNQNKKMDIPSVSNDESIIEQFSNIKSVEKFQDFNLKLNGEVYHMQTRQGDGGLDILVESGNHWSIYQCKFFVEGKITTIKEKGKGDYKKSDRVQQIENSFNKAINTAKNKSKVLSKWVLCVPKDLDDLEKKWLDDFKENNKEKCENIHFIGNLNLSNWLIDNENIYNYFFHKIIIKEKDLKISVFDKINQYRDELNSKIVNAENPAAKYNSNLSSFEELNLLFDNIREFRNEFMKVLNSFKDIDKTANYNKEKYENYFTEKHNMRENQKEKIADSIDETEKLLGDLISKDEIINFKDYLEKVISNFNNYFYSGKS